VSEAKLLSLPVRREPPASSSPSEPVSRPVAWLRALVLGLAAIWALVLAVVFALRIGHPVELEWMEGGTLQQAWRVSEGLPVYGPPSAEFVPFLYPPLYPALIAALAWVFPLGYPLARAVSIAAVLATCLGLARLTGYEGKPRAHQAVAVGLFLSGYVFGFRWLDLARGDALYLALVVWGLALLRECEGDNKKAVLAGVLVALGFWTKQTTAVFVLASALAGLLVAPRQVWIYAGTIAVIAGGGVLLGQALTDGWLWTWIYETHQDHAFNDERFRKKTWGMFVHAAPFAATLVLALIGVGGGLALRRLRQTRALIQGQPRARIQAWARTVWLGLRAAQGPLYWAIFAGAGLLVSALGYSTQFAEPNAFLPGICFGAAFVAVALPDSTLRRDELAGLLGLRHGLEVVGLALIAAQLAFALLVEPLYQPIQSHGLRAGLPDSYAWQDPWRTLPRPEQRREAARLRARIEALDPADGQLLALHRPWWSILAGGPGHVGAMGIHDVGPEQRAELEAELVRRLAEGRYQAVWIEGSVPRWLLRPLRDWTVAERRYGDARVRPLSGWMSEAGMVTPYTGEQLLLTPPRERPRPPGVEVLADFEARTLDGFEVVSGIAFGRRSVPSFTPGLPPIGPHGGARLLSSAASGKRLEARGEVRSREFVVEAGDAIEVLIGTSGSAEGLRAALVSDDGRRLEIAIPATRFDLQPVQVEVPSAWAGARVRLHLIDDDARAALFVDDLWLVR
jgi:hypothetical protein